MTAPIRPAGAKLFGKDAWLFVPAIADPSAPTVAELTAASAIDLSCYFYTSTGKPDVNQNRVTPPARICDTQQYEAMGLGQWQGGDVHYAVDPQAAAGSDGKKAYEALPEGTTGFLVNRPAVDINTAITAGQFVVSYPVQFGTQAPAAEGDGESSEFAVKQAFAITGPPSEIVAVAA